MKEIKMVCPHCGVDLNTLENEFLGEGVDPFIGTCMKCMNTIKSNLVGKSYRLGYDDGELNLKQKIRELIGMKYYIAPSEIGDK